MQKLKMLVSILMLFWGGIAYFSYAKDINNIKNESINKNNGYDVKNTLNSANSNVNILSMPSVSLPLNSKNGTQLALIDNKGNLSLAGWLSTYHHIVPDSLYKAEDGTDDAPSIQRALNILASHGQIGGEIDFLPRIYHLKSPVKQTNQGVWNCMRGHMSSGGSTEIETSRYGGTWFDIDRSFINSKTSPITIYGGAAIGAVIKGCAFYEMQPASNGSAIGLVSAVWVPNAYPPVINIDSVQGETFIEQTLWRGITKGIYSDFSGRMTINHMFGDFYMTGIEIHHAYDVDRIYDIHEWGFNNDKPDMAYYKTKYGSLLRIYRADSPIIDNIFSINMQSAITFNTDMTATSTSGVAMTGGVPTKVQIGKLTCDGSRHCIVNNAAGATFKAGIIDFQGADNTRVIFSAFKEGSAVEMAASGFGQIDQIYAQAVGESVVHMSGVGCSRMDIGSLILDEATNNTASGISGYVADGSACKTSVFGHANQVFLSKPATRFMVSSPATWMPKTSAMKLYWALTTAHK